MPCDCGSNGGEIVSRMARRANSNEFDEYKVITDPRSPEENDPDK